MTQDLAHLRAHAGDDCCMFSTVGRRTGKTHRLEIWFGVHDDVVYFISGNGPTADWFRNALANPSVTIELSGRLLHGTAREVVDPAERLQVGELMGAKYSWDGDPSIGLTRDAWCFLVPVLAVQCG